MDKANNTINPHGMWPTLRVNIVGEILLKAVQSFYEDSKACVPVGMNTSKWFLVNVGLRQGCVMSPRMINVYRIWMVWCEKKNWNCCVQVVVGLRYKPAVICR